ncbi:hypothetical protein DPEC_G00256990 [Dallia pectoralis]|uniref:Uncharacterized protein n=1 Tax=Dallia pectoralis TaxID=75939 RepID=A0ACC2FQU5_DALPE|nr:hypothetical protein DPEC_G00256990 [Dallia pectoralis]
MGQLPEGSSSDLYNRNAKELSGGMQLEELEDNTHPDGTTILQKMEKEFRANEMKPFLDENDVVKVNLQITAPKAQVNQNIPSMVDQSPTLSDAKPPANFVYTLAIVFLVLIILAFFFHGMMYPRRYIATSAARLIGRASATANTSRRWVSLSSLLDQMDSTMDKSTSEMTTGGRNFTWRPRRRGHYMLPQNSPVLDTVDFIQVPLNQFDTPLKEVVCHRGEAFNNEAFNKPFYTGSGLTEVSI